MAGSFTPTGNVYSNLTRLELEQLRKSDFAVSGRALTVGDGEGIVGAGSVNAESFLTGPSVALDDVYSQTPPAEPGAGLLSITQVGLPSETVRWYGPQLIATGVSGVASSGTQWTDSTVGLSFTALGVVANDILLVKDNEDPGSDNNEFAVATISSVAASTLTCTNINAPNAAVKTAFDTLAGDTYQYLIIRPNVVQLFAVPGSGPLGREQTFMMVVPGSALHSTVAPSIDAINNDRIRNLASPSFAGSTAIDRADAPYGPPNTAGPRGALNSLGYRVVLYKSNAAGTAPDLTQPIGTLSPVIDSTLPIGDQRMTIDYKAGIVRFSCAPRAGDDIKPTGGAQGVNATTGRLQLYAVFWAVDQSQTRGSARSIYTVRSTNNDTKVRGSIAYDASIDAWSMGASLGHGFVVRAYDPTETPTGDPGDNKVDFGTVFPSGTDPFRGFRIRNESVGTSTASKIMMIRSARASILEPMPTVELQVADKTAFTVGDGSSPAQHPGADYNPAFANGYRSVDASIDAALKDAAYTNFGVVHLRRGLYNLTQVIYVPPGVTLEGEGPATQLTHTKSAPADYSPMLHFGPNTLWGVYDFGAFGGLPASEVLPSEITHPLTTRIEGFDIVWNPLRRVWGIFQADVTSNTIWMNEMRPDGSFVLPGLGIDVKANANVLYKGPDSLNSSNHTTGHYPRAVFHSRRGDYVVTWVEEQTVSGNVGPIIRLQIINYNTTTNTYVRTYGSPVGVAPSGTYPFTDHPSVAVDEMTVAGTYRIGVSGWAYNFGLSQSGCMMVSVVASTGSTATFQVNNTGAMSVVSSTDVVSWESRDATTSEFLFSWSVRKHLLIEASDGAITSGASTLTSASHTTWAATDGVEVGSKVIIRSGTERGKAGWVRQISPASTLIVQLDTPGAPNILATQSGVSFSVAPLCRVFVSQTTTGATVFTSNVLVAGGPTTLTASNYYIQDREPDYVRLSRGEDRCILVYQTFDTNGVLNRANMKNFDNGFNAGFFLDSGTLGTLGSTVTHRQHLATCFVTIPLQTAGVPAMSENSAGFAATSLSFLTKARDVEMTRRSLGGHTGMVVPFQNHTDNAFNGPMEVCARVVAQKYPAPMIPDVTWTGSDWTIVSPPVSNQVKSDTGKYTINTGVAYLSDPTFYFGADATLLDGIAVRKTLDLGSSLAYFPATGEFIAIDAIVSEHSVQLHALSATLVSGTTNIVWYLIRDETIFGMVAGIKNPGFRVSAEGKVISHTTYMTYADEHADRAGIAGGIAGERNSAMMYRNLWGNVVYDSSPDPLRFGQVSQQFMDLMENQRLMGDVAFKGVAVGSPRGFNHALPEESPNVAIAWGENFYAFGQRNIAGYDSAQVNTLAIHRQSFGPYRSTVSNLRLTGRGSQNRLRVESRNRVYTRHGGPSSPNPVFETDGYRNVFLHFGVGALSNTIASTLYPAGLPVKDPRDPRHYVTHLDSVTTDALGTSPIRQRQSTLLEFPRSLDSSVTGRVEQTNQSKIVWTGKEFLAVIPTSNRLFLLSLPGDEDSQNPHDELTGDSTGELLRAFNPNAPLAPLNIVGVAAIDIGLGGTPPGPKFNPSLYPNTTAVDLSAPEAADIILFDVAWSGRVLACVWVSGLNTTALGNGELGGTVLGITIFYPGPLESWGANNCTTYVLDFERGASTKNRIRDPKITWDGTSFTISYLRRQPNSPNNVRLYSTVIPETGVESHTQIRRVRPLNDAGNFSGPGYLSALGQVNTDGTLNLNQGTADFIVQPGDMVYISRSGLGSGGSGNWTATAANFNLGAGYFTVRHVNVQTGRVDLGVDLTIAYSSGQFLYGAVFSGGQSPNVNTLDLYEQGGTIGAGPGTSVQEIPTLQEGFITDIASLWATIYNEVANEYVSFYTSVAGPSYATVWRKNSTHRRDVLLTSSAVVHMSVGWNGSHFLVTYITGSSIQYGVFNADLRMELDPTATTLATGSDLVGNGMGQVPGPGYGPYNASWTPNYTLVGVHVKWNGKLSRWVLSASIGWWIDATDSARYHTLKVADRTGYSVTTWTNRTLTHSGSNIKRQPGIRILASRYTNVMTQGSVPNDDSTVTSSASAGFDSITAIASSFVANYTGGTTINSRDDNYTGIVKNDVVELTNSSLGAFYTRRILENGTNDGNGCDHIYLEGGLYPPVATGNNYSFDVFHLVDDYLFNIQSGQTLATAPILVDTDASEVDFTASPIAGASLQFNLMPREDIFMWTLSPYPPAVQVLDADDVSLDSIEISGGVDVSERLKNLARPVQKNGGFAIGLANSATATTIGSGYKSHVASVLTTPSGKVSEPRLTNVRTQSRTYYGYSPVVGTYDRSQLNRRR